MKQMLAWLLGSPVEKKPLSLGMLGEQWGQVVYRGNGFTILAANEFNRHGKRLGEIDFIAKDKTSLAFVEVKTRSLLDGQFGRPEDAVSPAKAARLLRAVKVYLLKHPELADLRPHVDVCSIVVTSVDRQEYSVKILENAVEDWA